MKNLRRAFALACVGMALVVSTPPAAQEPPPLTKAVQDSPALSKAAQDVSRTSNDLLKAQWAALAARQKQASLAPRKGAAEAADGHLTDERFRPAPEQRGLALASVAPWYRPVEVVSAAGVLAVTLRVDYASLTLGADPVHLRCYNGVLAGPTLRAKPGDVLKIKLVNALPPNAASGSHANNTLHEYNTTNLHTHGLHVSPAGTSDNVLLDVLPGTTQDYEIRIPANHPAGTFWYHAHRHGSVAPQVASGMSGAIVIEGGMDAVPEIAATKGNRDRVMLLQQIPYAIPPGETEGVVEEGFGQFGPDTWNKSGRFTSINGVVLPVITMKPGEVERWRFVDSGFRERIDLRLVRESGGGPAALNFQEIAADGIPLGKRNTTPGIELWPGYRSDALVQAPMVEGVYLLIDEAVPPSATMTGDGKNRKHLAKVLVAGTPNPMGLPASARLAAFRPPSIPAAAVTGTQSATYGIEPVGASVEFRIDGKPYDPSAAPRLLTLGNVDEWTIRSVNGVGPVTHPFHIHVNAFEIFSIKVAGVEQLTEPIWRDTVAMKPDQTIRFRTRYDDFTGDFVQHCHILDHEDQGMMQKVRIALPGGQPAGGVAPAGGAAAGLIDRAGKPRSLAEFQGRPAVLVFFKGSGCAHCMKQLATTAAAIRDRGVPVVAVSSGTADDLANVPAAGFEAWADPSHAAFRRYKCFDTEPRHGTFVLDQGGRVAWQDVGDSPLMDATPVLAALARLAPAVEVEIRNTPTGDDDYITWAPTPCRIRVAPGLNPADDRMVTLTNDPPQPIPVGATVPPDGDVLFAAAVAAGATATQETLGLRLPKDGSWVPFVIAGKFGRPSTQGKDAVIQVHDGPATGPELASVNVMVRVRKDVRKLSAFEKTELLKALNDIHVVRNRLEWYVQLHRLATSHSTDLGDSANWADQAHRGPAFIAWHRAFLLQFERELQQTYPHVTFPYWSQGEVQTCFSADFLGATTAASELVTFDPLNPIYGWSISLGHDGSSATGPMGLLRRTSRDHNPLPTTFSYRTWADFQAVDDFSRFIPALVGSGPFRPKSLEANPHNNGHGEIGPAGIWMSNCRESNADPIFWEFHCHHDHLWATWQWYHGRFRTDGVDPKHYSPTVAYASGSDVALGHHLPDTMWPWDGTSGPNAMFPGDPNSVRPGPNTFGSFPKAPYPGQWPATAAKPRPMDTIDYLGLAAGTLEQGFCYEDVPYGTRPVTGPLAAPAAQDTAVHQKTVAALSRLAIGTFLSPTAAPDLRVDSARHIDREAAAARADQIGKLVRDADTSAGVRVEGLRLLFESAPDAAAREAVALLNAPSVPAPLAEQAAVKLGHSLHFQRLTPAQTKEVHDVFLAVAKRTDRPEARAIAVTHLAAAGDSEVENLLVGFLNDPKASPLPPPQVVTLLRFYPNQVAAVREQLDSQTLETRLAAINALTADNGSDARRQALATDAAVATDARLAAIRSLIHRSPSAGDTFLRLFLNPAEQHQVREEAGAALRVWLRTGGKDYSAAKKNAMLAALEGMKPTPAADSRLGRLREMATDVLKAPK